MDRGSGMQSLLTVSMLVSYMSIFVYPCSGRWRVMKSYAEDLRGHHIYTPTVTPDTGTTTMRFQRGILVCG
jgi:hypothetical protein